MGAWGYKNFENDTATDWFAELEESPDKELVIPYLTKILDEDDFIDDEESFITLAILEALNGRLKLISTDYRLPPLESVDTVVLSQMVISAAKKILFFKEHSEVRELWLESDEYYQWLNYQVSLIMKLESYYSKYNFMGHENNDPEIEAEWTKYIKTNFS
ncbi:MULTISPECIES: DUF4259 domain-containing protein [Chryseobacterium]|uniref:DUF4259 domain-containing protein n=1 Tax=Chryseobacterium bernardetii TaxID=1241978 RepID=A0A3G6TU60_9FLAO|nr:MULTISPECIES: DUF4259 domain-containing protein [Chryseobacterium]AZB26254.1 DUF4259 domain-containing protein [Chryseobacterium bernardetii]AZB32758.1 DUF4259 domain-containing protein [Chryseobacterium bernardetii]UCA60521.1 DUF4259 domain-containing protein [Chryseobacterium rhizoplanae]